jgi:hypothetical protein
MASNGSGSTGPIRALGGDQGQGCMRTGVTRVGGDGGGERL